MSMKARRSKLIGLAVVPWLIAGCVTEADHTHSTTLPNGKPGYVIICNSNRYDRCLNRAARVCAGAYTIIPEARSSTFRVADPVPGIGNGESILVSCGNH